MNQSTVFRKVAIDRLTSPDELTEVLRYTLPFDWLILAAIALLMAGALSWGITGHLQVTVEGVGLLESVGQDSGRHAVLFVGQAGYDRIRAGQAVRLTSKAFPPQQYGFLTGTITRTHPSLLGDVALRRALSTDELARLCIQRDLRMRVDIVLESLNDDPLACRWSSGRGPARPPANTELEGQILLRRERPVELVFPWFRSVPGRVQ